MTIQNLLEAREAVKALYQAPVDGKTALRIRRAVRKMEAPLSDYDEALKSWIEKEDVDGAQIKDLTEEQREYWVSMVTEGVEPDWEPPVSVDDLDGVELSAAQIDALVSAGMVNDDELEAKTAEEAEAAPA